MANMLLLVSVRDVLSPSMEGAKSTHGLYGDDAPSSDTSDLYFSVNRSSFVETRKWTFSVKDASGRLQRGT